MVRATHAKKEIEAALVYAESRGWRVQFRAAAAKVMRGGRMYCPYNEAECHFECLEHVQKFWQ
ncbi:MAG: hypothetical protein CPDRYMAC_3576 [uncultured Paraburkholderia sp.]|nr:MAG: hypothetical protein CPDRYDRY_3377 [uncultured Paraburkholderia sp.]CAH2931487.1 MAG: hypothetical protein CPDRYMAC_3576 [uncultured Paraburkholderia sp.]